MDTSKAEESFDITLLLKDFSEWKKQSSGEVPFSMLDYVQCIATPDMFFAFSELFFPRLVLHEGYYFIKERFSEALFSEWKKKLESILEIQKIINHFHIRCLFQEGNIDDKIAVCSAQRLADIWSDVFRDKGLIAVASGDCVDDASVTLYQPHLS